MSVTRIVFILHPVQPNTAHNFNTSAVKRSIGFTISFHNYGEGPYKDLLQVKSSYYGFHI